MCLDAKDSELNRPKLRKDPDAVIEVKQEIRSKDASVKSKDVYAELVKLDDLRKKGLLNEAEFESQKKKLLDSN